MHCASQSIADHHILMPSYHHTLSHLKGCVCSHAGMTRTRCDHHNQSSYLVFCTSFLVKTACNGRVVSKLPLWMDFYSYICIYQPLAQLQKNEDTPFFCSGKG